MGYMGFGMRKEVYTRKPKKAFEGENKANKKAARVASEPDVADEQVKASVLSRVRPVQRVTEFPRSVRIVALVFLAVLAGYGTWRVAAFLSKPGSARIAPNEQTNTVTIPYGAGEYRKTYNYFGALIQETYYEQGLRHQGAYTYYHSGETFRSALYYRDTLIREVYLFKNGDTIPQFPVLRPGKTHHITLNHDRLKQRVYFDLQADGNIVNGTYHEEPLQ